MKMKMKEYQRLIRLYVEAKNDKELGQHNADIYALMREFDRPDFTEMLKIMQLKALELFNELEETYYNEEEGGFDNLSAIFTSVLLMRLVIQAEERANEGFDADYATEQLDNLAVTFIDGYNKLIDQVRGNK